MHTGCLLLHRNRGDALPQLGIHRDFLFMWIDLIQNPSIGYPNVFWYTILVDEGNPDVAYRNYVTYPLSYPAQVVCERLSPYF